MQCMSSKTGFKLQVKRSGAAMAFIAMPHPCGGKMVTQPLLALLCNARPCSARVVWLLPHPLEPLERSLLSCLGFDRQAESLTSATVVAESISECIFPTG